MLNEEAVQSMKLQKDLSGELPQRDRNFDHHLFGPTEVHSFYQEVFISDLKKDI